MTRLRLGKWNLQLAGTRLRRRDSRPQMDEGSESTLNETEDVAINQLQQSLLTMSKAWEKCWAWIKLHSNFYRVHLLAFIIIPLIFSSIVYRFDTRGNSFVNCLTMCVSAMTTTGLNPVLMENTSHFQQAMVFFLASIGNVVAVSIVSIIIRRHFFKKRFDYMVRTNPRARKQAQDAESGHEKSGGVRSRLHMIRRVDAPVKVNQLNNGGHLMEASRSTPDCNAVILEPSQAAPEYVDASESFTNEPDILIEPEDDEQATEQLTSVTAASSAPQPNLRFETEQDTRRVRTVDPPRPGASRGTSRVASTLKGPVSMSTGFGGFPNPVKIAATAARDRLLHKSATFDLGRHTTLQSVYSTRGEGEGSVAVVGVPTKDVSYITFDAIVGRNSHFRDLTSAQRDELGGVEYRALTTLLKIVVAYFLLVQLIPILILAPVFNSRRYDWAFRDQDQGTVTGNGAWYVAFNVVAAFTNLGMSLLDESMVPFQKSYAYVLVLGFLIVAGNTGFPIFLRLTIWTLSKALRTGSRVKESLQFLLDHPRRCFIYLFPAHQTWFLVFVLVILNGIDWIAFVILDLDSLYFKSLSPAVKAVDGLFQSLAVRAAGFAIIPMSEAAPALKVLFVGMMYIAVYPVALSIRSTNVYEEKSMGLYQDHEQDVNQIEAEYSKSHSIGSYLGHHARQQLAFDIWWLGFALWIICIVEKRNIDDPLTDNYFTVFTVLFEMVSAYSCVGLSLGSVNAGYSLVGDFRPFSKLVLACVMIRGRHRGLPVAIDRSILLPSDLDAFYASPTGDSSTVSPPSEKVAFKSASTGGETSHWSASTGSPPTDVPKVVDNHAQNRVASSSANGILRTPGRAGSAMSPRSIKFA